MRLSWLSLAGFGVATSGSSLIDPVGAGELTDGLARPQHNFIVLGKCVPAHSFAQCFVMWRGVERTPLFSGVNATVRAQEGVLFEEVS